MVIDIYRARAGAPFEQAMDVLREAGLRPVALDDPNPPAIYQLAAMGSLRIRIGVPDDEAAAAREVLLAWERDTRAAAGEHASTFRRSLSWTLVLMLVGAAVIRLGFPDSGAAPWWALVIGGFVALVVIDRNFSRDR